MLKKGITSIRRHAVLLSVLATLMPISRADALRLDLATGLDAEYSSNLLRTQSDEEQALTMSLWGAIALREQSAALNAELAAAIEQEAYIGTDLGYDTLVSLASRVDYRISPERFSWHLEDYLQQLPRDTLQPISPTNLQTTNVFWTGPDVALHLSQLYRVDAGARYGNYYYGDSNNDNQRLAGLLRATRLLSQSREIYAGAQLMQVAFDDPDAIGQGGVRNADFNQLDAYVGASHESELTRMHLDLGRTTVDRDGLDDVSGLLAVLSLQRRMAHSSELSVDLSRRITETGASLLSSAGTRLEVAPGGGTSIVQDIAAVTAADVSYRTLRAGLGIRVALFARSEDFEVSQYDRRGYGGLTEVELPLEQAWRLLALARYSYNDYDELGFTDRDYGAEVRAEQRVTRHITFAASLGANFRASSGDRRDFNEYVGLLSIRYGDRPTWTGR